MRKLNPIFLLDLFESYICFVFILVNFKNYEKLRAWKQWGLTIIDTKGIDFQIYLIKRLGLIFSNLPYNTLVSGCVIGKAEKTSNIILLTTARTGKEERTKKKIKGNQKYRKKY